MKIIFHIVLFALFSTTTYGQVEFYPEIYSGAASSDSAYGVKIGKSVSMKVELILNLDSTYSIYWNFDFDGWCGFDSTWFNSGRWIKEKDIIYFTLTEDEEYENSGKKDYPIVSMNQERLNIFSQKENKQIQRFLMKHPEYEYYLKLDDGRIIQFNAEWDCIEELWRNKTIIKKT